MRFNHHHYWGSIFAFATTAPQRAISEAMKAAKAGGPKTAARMNFFLRFIMLFLPSKIVVKILEVFAQREDGITFAGEKRVEIDAG